MYKIIIIPSSDDERRIEDVASFEEARKLHDDKVLEASSIHEFNSGEELEAFIKGYKASIGYLGEGVFFIK